MIAGQHGVLSETDYPGPGVMIEPDHAGQAVITETDYARLKRMIGSLRGRLATRHPMESHLRELENMLIRSTVVPPAAVRADTVTMNSKIRLRDLEANVLFDVTPTYPSDADPYGEKISVLAGLGAALLGARVGDVIEWKTHRGTRHARVEQILFQPEAAGYFDL